MKTSNLLIGISVTLLVIAGVGYFHGEDRPQEPLTLEVIQDPKDAASAGQRVPAESISEGPFTLVSFWASWCKVCEGDAVQLAAISEELGAKINIVGVIMADSKEDLQASGKLVTRTSAQFYDADGRFGARYQVRSLPTTLLLDEDKNPILRQDGAIDAKFRSRLAKLIQAKETSLN